jgi:hypothetical protein
LARMLGLRLETSVKVSRPIDYALVSYVALAVVTAIVSVLVFAKPLMAVLARKNIWMLSSIVLTFFAYSRRTLP